MAFRRYAIFHTPAPGPLARFGAAWLGWDSATGQAIAHPDIPGLPLPMDEATAAPHRYGLHGTIKPPFRLADGQSETHLAATFRSFCGTLAPVCLDALELACLGRFLALVPTGDCAALNALAAHAVRSLDAFRAPLDEAELTRRRGPGLPPAQEALLLRWGYPYMMEAFRFHLTLTGKLPKRRAAELVDILGPHLLPLVPAPYVIDALSLMGEDETGHFHVIERRALSG